MYLTLQNSSFIKQISYTIEDKMETMCGWEMGVQWCNKIRPMNGWKMIKLDHVSRWKHCDWLSWWCCKAGRLCPRLGDWSANGTMTRWRVKRDQLDGQGWEMGVLMWQDEEVWRKECRISDKIRLMGQLIWQMERLWSGDGTADDMSADQMWQNGEAETWKLMMWQDGRVVWLEVCSANEARWKTY